MKINNGTRKTSLDQAQNELQDLLVIGGGITGAGVARDAASRGMRVILLEASDFSSGTSSRSSKLIHGGIRYLENLDFKLVFEALSERSLLFEIAPHLVHPLKFMIPLFKDSRVSYWKMGMGMWLYDLLSLFQAPELHQGLNSLNTLREQPELRAKDLVGSYTYWDAYMDDDRLTLETLRSASHYGAALANYSKVTGVEKKPEYYEVNFHDEINNKTGILKARSVICCTGPWTDLTGQMLQKEWKKVLRPTKGIHLVLSKKRLSLKNAVVMGAEQSDRIVFGIPRGDYVIIGTTDTDYKDDPSAVKTEVADVDYLLKVVNSYFPDSNLRVEDILSSYSGVRPLVKDDAGTEGKTSREHAVFKDALGVHYVTGGKYTTFRKMAEDAVQNLLKDYSYDDRVKFKESKTKEPINPKNVGMAHRQLIASMVDSKDYKMVEKYGAEAFEIINLSPGYSYLQKEVLFHIENTMCLNIVDFYLRRCLIFLTHRDHGLSHFDEVAHVFREHLDYTDSQVNSDLLKLKELMKNEFSWQSAN